MKNIFVFLKNDSLLPMIQVYLNGHKEFKVFVQNDINQLTNDLNFIGEADFLISEVELLAQVNQNLLSDIPKLLLFTSTLKSNTSREFYYTKDNWENLCEEILGQVSPTEIEEYSDIPFSLLKSIKTPPCDIFIEILKNNSPHQIKLFNKNEPIDQLTVEKYFDKGLRLSKVFSKEKKQLLNSISNEHFITLLDDNTPDIVGKALDTSLLLLKEIGFNSTSTQLIEGVVDAINKNLKNSSDKGMSEIKNLLESKASRYYKKAHLTSIISGKVLSKAEWATHRHQDLLTFISLMSDITLEKEEMLYITSAKDLSNSRLSQVDKDKIWTHARDAFNLIQAYKDRPLESDLLILEHHGNKNGIGFSENLNAQLSKLIIIFRICEDFSIELLKLKDLNADIKLMDIFQHLYLKHDKKILHLVIDDLKKCFID